MLAEDLIVDYIPPLSPEDTGETALQWMDEFKVQHLSVVDRTQFLGTISEADVLGMSDLSESIGQYRDLMNRACVLQNQHIFEVVKVVNDHFLTIVPVLDTQENYKGSITIAQLMRIIADMPMANDSGGIIVLELNRSQYSLRTIAAIVEEDGAQILGCYITAHPDSTKLQLTIKVNRTEIRHIIASLERHDYSVSYFAAIDLGDDMNDRFDAFMKFLNI